MTPMKILSCGVELWLNLCIKISLKLSWIVLSKTIEHKQTQIITIQALSNMNYTLDSRLKFWLLSVLAHCLLNSAMAWIVRFLRWNFNWKKYTSGWKQWKKNEQKWKINEQGKVIKINIKVHVQNNKKKCVCLICLKIVQYFELYCKPIWLLGVFHLLDVLPNWHNYNFSLSLIFNLKTLIALLNLL